MSMLQYLHNRPTSEDNTGGDNTWLHNKVRELATV